MSDYVAEADFPAIARDYPIGAAFLDRFRGMSRDALRVVQETRFATVMARAWQVPFYRRRWSEAGLQPGDIRGLDDLPKIPPFSKADIMASVAAHPPLGDFHGLPDSGPRPAVVLHTTSGTTGDPQPLLYGARDREIQNALLARAYKLQGMVDGDVVHSVYGFGPVNGGHYIREALLRFTKTLHIPAGTGIETRTEQQVRLMARFGATVLVGFGDYLFRLAEEARRQGLEPGRDIPLRMIAGHIAHDTRAVLEASWGGVQAFDWYGVGDTGILAAEGAERDGLYLMEDAHVIELLDPETGTPVADGQAGNITATVLFKDGVYPIIRFDTKDLSTIRPGANPLDLPFRRIEGFQGRSDNMVKLRGINVYPTAVGAALAEIEPLGGEYVCLLSRGPDGEAMTVRAETASPSNVLRTAVEAHLKARIGVTIAVELVAMGGTAALTEIERRQKPLRLVDLRLVEQR
ncbi:MAG: phenylacetate--CoA ligase family protein [Alphaproteobacteria bacterium]|nr:phenylacetate--CoA ligase family protein [Alphaproteobacteria bacterium]